MLWYLGHATDTHCELRRYPVKDNSYCLNKEVEITSAVLVGDILGFEDI